MQRGPMLTLGPADHLLTSAKMHRLRVQPGESLGPFVLGMSLNDVVALLARRPADTPRAAAPWGRVELVYDPKVSRLDELSPCR